MKISIMQTVAGFITIGTLCGSVIAFDNYYAHKHELIELAMEYKQDKIENAVSRMQERQWKLEDRKEELLKRNGETKDIDEQLRDIKFQIEKEKEKLKQLK
jgi:hypothetical protein